MASFFAFRRARSKRKQPNALEPEEISGERLNVQVGSKQFEFFPQLSDELKGTILRFVTDAPLEGLPSPTSSLTHVLNKVNKQFHSICNSNEVWKECLIRVAEKEPILWREALRAELDTGDDETSDEMSTCALAEAVQSKLSIPWKDLYKCLMNNRLRRNGPVFFMPTAVTLGEAYGLHFFEHRYRLLISDVMRDQPEEARNGGAIENPVYFVHAHQGPLEATSLAVLVQVIRCHFFQDGRADVLLLPIRYMWIERLWVRPNSGNLFCAQCLNMGQKATQATKTLQQRTSLANVVDRLIQTLAAHVDEDDTDENAEEVD